MKHFILVLSVILFILLIFLYPSTIEDASFNDYTYLRNIRRSDNTIDNEYTKKKLYENTYFNTHGSVNSTTGNSSVGFAPILYSNTTPTDQKIDSKSTNLNFLPYLFLLLILVIIIVYVKYKMN